MGCIRDLTDNTVDQVTDQRPNALPHRGDDNETAPDFHAKFSQAAASLARLGSYEEICARAVNYIVEATGYIGAAIYVPRNEHARMVNAADAYRSIDDDQSTNIRFPQTIRVDLGLLGDSLAADRSFFTNLGSEMEQAGLHFRSLYCLPMRDQIGRPLGLILLGGIKYTEKNDALFLALERFVRVIASLLELALRIKHTDNAVQTLPELSGIAKRNNLEQQLHDLARIAMRATSSDAAVIRILDDTKRFIETRAVVAQDSAAVADAIGTRTKLDEPHTKAEIGKSEYEFLSAEGELSSWSPGGQRILKELSARTVGCYPIYSDFDNLAVLYVLRSTARAFDEVDRASLHIITAQAQHVIDRKLAQQSSDRAAASAHSAVRLLGEALVAGVRAERTLRFVPRLFKEMFSPNGVRIWRRDESSELTLLAGEGKLRSKTASDILTSALEHPLQLEFEGSDDRFVFAVSFDGYGSSRYGIELEREGNEPLDAAEQRLIIDVASRINEALYSAGQAANQQQQLLRYRALHQISVAHTALDGEERIVDGATSSICDLYGASGAAFILINEIGEAIPWRVTGLPAELFEGIEGARGWLSDLFTGRSQAIVTIDSIQHDERLSEQARFVARKLLPEEHAALAVPIRAHEQTIAVLVLAFKSGFSDELKISLDSVDEDPLLSFGEQIGTSILGARALQRERSVRKRAESLLDHERENARQVRALHDVSQTFANSMSYDETLRAVAEALTDRLDVDAVWIRTKNERGEAMEVRAFHALNTELGAALERIVEPDEPIDDPITVEVLRSRRSLLITDTSEGTWSGSSTLTRLDPFLRAGSSLAVIPMKRPGSSFDNITGTISLFSIDPAHELDYNKVYVASNLADQAALALDNARLYQQQKSFAEVIQESLLPNGLPDVPQLDYGVLYRQSAAVGGNVGHIGGDFYDFFQLDDGRVAMALGDVTGKGIQAAADTFMTKYVFRALAREHPMPASFLRYANEVICDEITSGKFVTLFYAVIDPERQTFTCGLAGHPEPKILYPEGVLLPNENLGSIHEPRIESIQMEGLALGILPGQDFEQREYPFPPGASLIVYTDGVVEARREGRLYGQYRLERRIADESGGGANQIAFSIFEDCHAYAEQGLDDDVAIVVVRHFPTETQT